MNAADRSAAPNFFVNLLSYGFNDELWSSTIVAVDTIFRTVAGHGNLRNRYCQSRCFDELARDEAGLLS